MSLTERIRIMLVDDHPVMRRGLREVLEELGGFEVVAQAADGEEAVRMAQEARPDVVVMDVLMPKKGGIDACREILELLPDTKVLMLTASTQEHVVIEAVAAGATGFVHKCSGSEELVAAVREVAAGRLKIPDEAVRLAFRVIGSGAGAVLGPNALTARQRETLTIFARGGSYADIAEALGVSTMTVRNSMYRIQDKLGLGSKQELVVWAVRNGLLDEMK